MNKDDIEEIVDSLDLKGGLLAPLIMFRPRLD